MSVYVCVCVCMCVCKRVYGHVYIPESVCLLYVRQCAYMHYVLTKVVDKIVSIKCYLPVSTLLSEKMQFKRLHSTKTCGIVCGVVL